MAQPIALHSAPHLRLPVKTLTVGAFVVLLLAGSAVFPRSEVSADMAWRGNSGRPEALR